jgi:uncharacterized cupredoxin-like copper-binding protein
VRLRRFDASPSGVRSVPARGAVSKLRRSWYLVAVAIVSLGLAGGVMAADRAIDAGARQVAVTARNLRFEPAEIAVPSGGFVVIRLTNADPTFHDWEVEGLANVDAGARPGQTQTIRVRLDRPGTYRVVCTVPGHASAGMVGTLIVEP